MRNKFNCFTIISNCRERVTPLLTKYAEFIKKYQWDVFDHYFEIGPFELEEEGFKMAQKMLEDWDLLKQEYNHYLMLKKKYDKA